MSESVKFMCLHRYQSHWRPRVILTGADKPFNLYAANLRGTTLENVACFKSTQKAKELFCQFQNGMAHTIHANWCKTR